MANIKRPLTQDEINRLKDLKLKTSYTKDEIVFLTNIHNEYIHTYNLCFTCNNALRELKNNIYGWFNNYQVITPEPVIEETIQPETVTETTEEIIPTKSKAGRPPKK